MKIGIIGIGVVGSALVKALKFFDHETFTYDKFKKSDVKSVKELFDAEIIFLCLPTPDSDDGIDMSAYEEIMPQLKGYTGVVVIKSTVKPGAADRYVKEFGLRIVSNPEFLREEHAFHDFMVNRIVVGGENEDVGKVLKVFEKLNVPKIVYENNTAAEITKYMSNCFLAMKVVFANEFNDLCEKYCVNYNDIIRGVGSDPRIGESHLSINKERGYGGNCFPKDMHAMSKESELIKFVHEQNTKNIQRHKRKDQ